MRARHMIKAAMGGTVAALLMGLVLIGSPAGAQDGGDYAEVLNTTIDRPTVGGSCNNTDITVTTSELQPGSDVTFTLYSDPVVLGTVTAGDDGTATLVFDLPAGTTLGRHEIVTTGINSFGVADSSAVILNVTSCATAPGPSGPGNDGLARTGTDVSTPIRAAVLVFAGGAALLLVSRKRQARSA